MYLPAALQCQISTTAPGTGAPSSSTTRARTWISCPMARLAPWPARSPRTGARRCSRSCGPQSSEAVSGRLCSACDADRFAALGFPRVEATSYSNPEVVPQFADASELLRTLSRSPSIFYKATCANVRAVDRALAGLDAGYGANKISLLVSATESHTQKNLNPTRAEQWQNIAEMVKSAKGRFRLVGTVSVAFGCPFEGKVDQGVVVEDVQRFASLGVEHVALGDTTGMATPRTVKEMFERTAEITSLVPIAHFPDTRRTRLLNYVAAFEARVRHFDSSFAGVPAPPSNVNYGPP